VSDGSFTVAPTASSGLTVVITSGSLAVCTVSGLTVNLVGSGTCFLYANQPGNVYYSAAPQILQTFTVNKTARNYVMFIALFSPDKSLESVDLGSYAAANVVEPLRRVPGVGDFTIDLAPASLNRCVTP